MAISSMWAAKRLILVLAIGMFVQGCGGDESSSASLTKARFVERANAICKKALADRSKAVQAAFQDLPPAKIKDGSGEVVVIEQVVSPMFGEMVEELHALGLPEEDPERVERLLASFDEAADRLRGSLGKNPPDTSLFTKMNKEVTAYGLSSCVD